MATVMTAENDVWLDAEETPMVLYFSNGQIFTFMT